MEGSALIIVSLIDAHSSGNEQQAVLQLIGLSSDMERSFSEISKGVDIYAGVIDESADDLDRGVHSCVVDRRPVALIPVVDIDGKLGYLFFKVVNEGERLVFENRLQEIIVQLVILLPALFPNGLAGKCRLGDIGLRLGDLRLIGIADHFVDVLFVIAFE